MKIDIKDLKIKFKFRDDPEFPANVTLTIGQFEVRGFSIRKSQFEENSKRFVMYPPASRGGKGWIKICFVYDKEDWKEFEDWVLKKFEEEHTEYLFGESIKSESSEKEIDVSGIKF